MDHRTPLSHGHLAREALKEAGFEQVDRTSQARHLAKAQSMPALRSGHHHDPRYKQAPDPLALQAQFRHQIQPVANQPVTKKMNFQERMVRISSPLPA